ncbi:MAG: 30S ribosomal protein S3 [Candidatus Portnoybacteria bacterium]|nr:30S ribosomal protein S3 [Candidatus Portnoybacteria bacterium]
MGRKINPRLYRINILKNWNSHWFAPKLKFKSYLEVDHKIREMVFSLFQKGVIDKVIIERSSNSLKVIIFTTRPGLVVGKQGTQIREIERRVGKFVKESSDEKVGKLRMAVEIQEIKDPELHANIIAQEVASQLERRMPYKRILKQTLERVKKSKEVKGVKIKVKGRLGGAEIARTEWVFAGSVPLQTLRSDIDYGFSEAITKWGAVGVKVWIYKGQMFEQKETDVSF